MAVPAYFQHAQGSETGALLQNPETLLFEFLQQRICHCRQTANAAQGGVYTSQPRKGLQVKPALAVGQLHEEIPQPGLVVSAEQAFTRQIMFSQ